MTYFHVLHPLFPGIAVHGSIAVKKPAIFISSKWSNLIRVVGQQTDGRDGLRNGPFGLSSHDVYMQCRVSCVLLSAKALSQSKIKSN